MEFKVWDMVRPTREYFINLIEDSDVKHLEYPNWFQIIKIDGNKIYYDDEGFSFHRASDLELVPEEPEFEFWEIIEVRDDDHSRWSKVRFLFYLPEQFECRYLCVQTYDFDAFQAWDLLDPCQRKYARKPWPQLTRKEIAEKFWVAEDFELIEE